MHSKDIWVSLKNNTDTELDLEIKIYDRVILQYLRYLFVHRCDKATQCEIISYHVLRELIKKVDTDTLDIEEGVKKHRRKKFCPPASRTATIITKGRKTTFEERLEIVTYCITHNHNYTETSEKFSVSYQQARNYAVKYEAGGVDALQDKRGKRKPENDLSEVERLRAEPKIEKAMRQKAEMEVSFLKT